jgi:hypothetical protein
VLLVLAPTPPDGSIDHYYFVRLAKLVAACRHPSFNTPVPGFGHPKAEVLFERFLAQGVCGLGCW